MANTRSFKPKTSPESSSEPTKAEDIVGEVREESPVKSEEPQIPAYSERPPEDQDAYPYQARNGYHRGGFRGGYRDRSESETRDVPTEEVSGYLDIMPEGHGF